MKGNVSWENARNDRKQIFALYPSSTLEEKQEQCIASSFFRAFKNNLLLQGLTSN